MIRRYPHFVRLHENEIDKTNIMHFGCEYGHGCTG